MKTNMGIKVTACILMLSLPVSIINVPKAFGDNVSKSASEKASLEAALVSKSINLGFWIEPVVVTYDRAGKSADAIINEKDERDTDDSVSIESTDMSKKAFHKSESMPILIGDNDLHLYLQQQIKYPEPAVARKVEGEVVLTFTVNADGYVTNAHIVKDIGSNCGLTAVEALRHAKFHPAMQNGYAVPCNMKVSFQFKLPE